jgi:hypothetical protein
LSLRSKPLQVFVFALIRQAPESIGSARKPAAAGVVAHLLNVERNTSDNGFFAASIPRTDNLSNVK